MRLLLSLPFLALFATTALAQQQTGEEQDPAPTAPATAPSSQQTGESEGGGGRNGTRGPSFIEPQGGFGGRVGGDCAIEWSEDRSGNWTNARIDLMTGSDIFKRALVKVEDNFDASQKTSTSHKCPDVDAKSTIYFYRMVRLNSKGGEADRIYTARFCISDGGACSTPANAEQPTGGGDPWGRGYLAGST